MKVLDLFSGIGGFSLGFEAAGIKTVAFCEFDKHAQKVLKKHWPDVPIYDDVRTLDGSKFKGSVDVVCGGFPCQDLSAAGKQAGFGGERSSLYREMLRIISECLPKYAIFENVTGLLSGDGGRWFARFLYDLAEVGYDAEWHCISASAIGAHHHRDRVWVIAYPKRYANRSNAGAKPPAGNEWQELQQKNREALPGNPGSLRQNLADSDGKRRHGGAAKQGPDGREITKGGGNSTYANGERGRGRNPEREDAKNARQPYIGERIDTGRVEIWDAEPGMGRVANGVPGRTHRLKQLGNSVTPQIPEIIGRAIMSIENEKRAN